jgi:hypothetical protein
MKILIVSDTFYPAPNAAARMLYDMYLYLKVHHEVSVITGGLQNEIVDDITYFKLQKSKNNIFRLFNELFFALKLTFQRKTENDPDIVIWYSPSIFLSIFVGICFQNKRRVMILRDLFPLWLEQESTLKPGPARSFLRYIERYQYKTAHTILVQTHGDISLIKNRGAIGDIRVLNNWYSVSKYFGVKPSIASFNPKTFKIIYAGNAGTAQKLEESITVLSEKLLQQNCAAELHVFSDKVQNLSDYESGSLRIKIFEPFDFESTDIIYQKYDFGLVSLNTKLTTNNIPGKYVSYISYGLPVFVYCSPKIDLFAEVNEYKVGIAFNSEIFDLSLFNYICRNYSTTSANARDLSLGKYNVDTNLKMLLKVLEKTNENL